MMSNPIHKKVFIGYIFTSEVSLFSLKIYTTCNYKGFCLFCFIFSLVLGNKPKASCIQPKSLVTLSVIPVLSIFIFIIISLLQREYLFGYQFINRVFSV